MERAGADTQLPGLEPGSSILLMLPEDEDSPLGGSSLQWPVDPPLTHGPLLTPSAPATWAPLTKPLTQHTLAHSQLTLSCTLTHTQPHTLTHSHSLPPAPSDVATQDPLTKPLTQYTLTHSHSDMHTDTLHSHSDTVTPTHTWTHAFTF